jgi:hypothetical protein
MAQGQYNPKPTTSHPAKEKTPESRSLVLMKFFIAGATAGLIVAVGIEIWENHSPDGLYRPLAFANEIRCNNLNVVVHSPAHQDALTACEGARDAIEFLAYQDLDVANIISIDIVTNLPLVAGRSAAGCYLESERRIIILVYSEFRKFNTWFGISINRLLYRSLIAHEVAHLVADHNFKVPKPSIQAKEYIAYVTQLSTMELPLRKRAMSHFECKAFEGDWQMNETIYMFDCMEFGVRAYMHFLTLTNRRDYLQAVLNGKALVE